VSVRGHAGSYFKGCANDARYRIYGDCCDVPEGRGEKFVEYPTGVGAYSPTMGRLKTSKAISHRAHRGTEKTQNLWVTHKTVGFEVLRAFVSLSECSERVRNLILIKSSKHQRRSLIKLTKAQRKSEIILVYP
jgi:hypothetical protein